jgi:hypothetical protein
MWHWSRKLPRQHANQSDQHASAVGACIRTAIDYSLNNGYEMLEYVPSQQNARSSVPGPSLHAIPDAS